ncbi:MAG: hypothetical protein IPF68_06370 [Bacteroidales bacterium]|nr:hypothetical protein [Bacteroidales bacterium]
MAGTIFHKYLIYNILFLLIGSLSIENACARELKITFHIRGVAGTNVSLIPLSGPKLLKSIADVKSVKSGQTAFLTVPDEYLPGEFILRFDYRQKPESTPYPSEKHILIGSQSLELWVHPMFANNSDSTWFQQDEREQCICALYQ